MNDAEIPEVDRQDGTNHPRHTKNLYGHKTSQLDFLDAFNTDRLHHAWMISGPRGIGKATLGYKISKFILSRNQSSELINNELQNTLDIPLDHPVSKRIDALGEPNLYLVRRIWDEKVKKI
jgi:DNA polymerase-3 subunit delta'